MPAFLALGIVGDKTKEEQLYAVKEEHKEKYKNIRKKIGQKEGRKQA
ncbi:MAG: hypothetical protein L0220_35590 [Acidobacteria bacterium]|nr:hypothetical protein [Acidobacteriota bacterium]